MSIGQWILYSLQQNRNRKYSEAIEAHCGSFTLFITSVDGPLGYEANVIQKRIGNRLSLKWNKSYSEVMSWIRARLSFLLIYATDLCLKGSRVKWRSGIGIEDGAGLPLLEF